MDAYDGPYHSSIRPWIAPKFCRDKENVSGDDSDMLTVGREVSPDTRTHIHSILSDGH